MITHAFPVRKSIGLLIDPDKGGGAALTRLLDVARASRTDYILVGGSLSAYSTDELIAEIKNQCSIPVVLFPGSLLQLSLKADIILFLSLISGRNPELLIGNHVIAAPFLRSSKNKVISAGYMLIGGGSRTSVEYISQTEAIPPDKKDIAVATALAGEMLGLKMLYLEAGSGASSHIPVGMLREIRQAVSIPIAAGGGVRDGATVTELMKAGADLVILGNGCEENPELLNEACKARDMLRAPSV